MKMKLVTALVVITVSNPVFATMTIGQPDCGQWIKEIGVRRQFNEQWLLGWLSGVNSAIDAKSHPSQTPPDYLAQITSAAQAFLVVDNFCRANPLSSVSAAAEQLMADLINKKHNK